MPTRLIVPALVLLILAGSRAGAAEVSTNGGLKVVDESGDFAFQLKGRFMIDSDSYDGVLNQENDGDRAFNTNFRRARLEFGGTAYADFDYDFHIDYNSRVGASIHTIGVRYKGFEAFDIYIGRTKEPFILEELTSSKALSSIERNYFSEVTDADSQPHYGLRFDGKKGPVRWQAGLFNPQGNPQTSSGSDRIAATGRFWGTPIIDDGKVLHLGAGYTNRNLDEPTEVNGFKLDIAENGGEANSSTIIVDSAEAASLELLYIGGPFSFQTEVTKTLFGGAPGEPDAEVDALYLQATYTLTGESRGYKQVAGIPDVVKPQGPRGAVELVAKIDYLDFDVDGLPSETTTGYLVGANWWVNRNFKLMLNYIYFDTDNVVDDGPEDSHVFSTRVQFAF